MFGKKKKKQLRVAVIGCGQVSELHLRAIAEAEEARLVGVCDTDKERLAAVTAEYDVRGYTNFRRMLRRARPDAVHICLPNHLHAPVANYCLAKGKHVLSEKPMALDTESAERTVRYAALAEKQYGVLFPYRYHSSVTLVRDALASGRLGAILSVRSILTGSRLGATTGGWQDQVGKVGGGILMTEAIDILDLVSWLVESEPESVFCTMANRTRPELGIEDTAEGLVIYQNGVRYGFYCMNNYETDTPMEIRLTCENGEAVFGYDSATITYRDGMSETAREGERHWDRGHRHAQQIGEFYRACLGQENRMVSGADVLATHRLVFALYEAARTSVAPPSGEQGEGSV